MYKISEIANYERYNKVGHYREINQGLQDRTLKDYRVALLNKQDRSNVYITYCGDTIEDCIEQAKLNPMYDLYYISLQKKIKAWNFWEYREIEYSDKDYKALTGKERKR